MNQYESNWQEAQQKALEDGLKVVDYGWEQHVIIDEKAGIIYRYPRHDAAAAKLEDEVSVLGDINTHTWPIKLPVMIKHNQVCTSYKYIAGDVLEEIVQKDLSQTNFDLIGKDLGAFLAQFHKLERKIVEQKKTKHSTSLFEYYDERIENSASDEFKAKAKPVIEDLKAQAGKLNKVVVHGDLHALNVVVNESTKQLVGVIDLSEMEIGDPHQEFRKIFMSFPNSLDACIESYLANGGQSIDKQTIILWAYANEWANACYFADEPDNFTYQRAVRHLQEWGQF